MRNIIHEIENHIKDKAPLESIDVCINFIDTSLSRHSDENFKHLESIGRLIEKIANEYCVSNKISTNSVHHFKLTLDECNLYRMATSKTAKHTRFESIKSNLRRDIASFKRVCV